MELIVVVDTSDGSIFRQMIVAGVRNGGMKCWDSGFLKFVVTLDEILCSDVYCIRMKDLLTGNCSVQLTQSYVSISIECYVYSHYHDGKPCWHRYVIPLPCSYSGLRCCFF